MTDDLRCAVRSCHRPRDKGSDICVDCRIAGHETSRRRLVGKPLKIKALPKRTTSGKRWRVEYRDDPTAPYILFDNETGYRKAFGDLEALRRYVAGRMLHSARRGHPARRSES